MLKDHKTIKTWRRKNFNEQMFFTDDASANWIRALCQTHDINILVSNCSNLFSSVIEKYAPVQRMLISEKYCPWVNDEFSPLLKIQSTLETFSLENELNYLE